jgi:prepilin-type N-terminal cleavage/methylation domain-containing protein
MMHARRAAARRSTRASVPSGNRFGQRGFSLVEVIVAIALFGISMSAIGALTFTVTRQAARGAAAVERTAALEGRVNDLFSIIWTDIPARVGCTTITTPPFPRTECITASAVVSGRRTVTLTITPTDATIQPTAITVERTMPPAGNPFRVAP